MSIKNVSTRNTVLVWVGVVLALVLIAVGLANRATGSGNDHHAPQAAPVASQAPPVAAPSDASPFTAAPVLHRVPTATNLQILDGYLFGTANFAPNDFLPAGCSLTNVGTQVSSLILEEQVLVPPAGFTPEVWASYVKDSQLIFSNTRMVDSSAGPRIVADVHMVPIGGPFRAPGLPTYLDAPHTSFSWMLVNDGHGGFDPLVKCNSESA